MPVRTEFNFEASHPRITPLAWNQNVPETSGLNSFNKEKKKIVSTIRCEITLKWKGQRRHLLHVGDTQVKLWCVDEDEDSRRLSKTVELELSMNRTKTTWIRWCAVVVSPSWWSQPQRTLAVTLVAAHYSPFTHLFTNSPVALVLNDR